MTAPQLLLDPEQLAAVRHRHGHLVVAAGAGTGKTHTLAHRCAALIEDGIRPHQIILLAFTNAAADEIKLRVAGLVPDGDLITAGTFHSLAHRLLRCHGHLTGIGDFSVLNSAEAESALSMLRKEMDFGLPAEVKSRRVLELISYEANTYTPLADLCARHYPQHLAGAFLLLQDAFFRYKRDSGLLDYDDLLHGLLELLQRHPAIVSEYRHALVDEAQDTNPLQLALLRRLTELGIQLTAVGDPCQSIYAFRGALPSVMQDLSAGAEVFFLRRNRRSGQPVLDYANWIIRACPGLIRADLVSDGRPAAQPTVTRCRDEDTESRHVAAAVRRLLDGGTPPDEIAALYSSSQHGLLLQLELTRLRVPFLTRGGLRLHDTAHVRDMLALLRLALHPREMQSMRRVLRLIPGIGEVTALKLARDPAHKVPPKAQDRHADLLACLRAMSLASPAHAWSLAFCWYEPLLDSPHRRHELEQVGSSLKGRDDLRAWLDEMALDSSAQEDGKGKVCLSTVHSAKGREFHAVFVLGLAQGRFDRGAAPGSPEYHEAVRLFYVACTRAKRCLEITVPLFCRCSDGGFRHVRASSLLP